MAAQPDKAPPSAPTKSVVPAVGGKEAAARTLLAAAARAVASPSHKSLSLGRRRPGWWTLHAVGCPWTPTSRARCELTAQTRTRCSAGAVAPEAVLRTLLGARLVGVDGRKGDGARVMGRGGGGRRWWTGRRTLSSSRSPGAPRRTPSWAATGRLRAASPLGSVLAPTRPGWWATPLALRMPHPPSPGRGQRGLRHVPNSLGRRRSAVGRGPHSRHPRGQRRWARGAAHGFAPGEASSLWRRSVPAPGAVRHASIPPCEAELVALLGYTYLIGKHGAAAGGWQVDHTGMHTLSLEANAVNNTVRRSCVAHPAVVPRPAASAISPHEPHTICACRRRVRAGQLTPPAARRAWRPTRCQPSSASGRHRGCCPTGARRE